jgi:hypothetical protein
MVTEHSNIRQQLSPQAHANPIMRRRKGEVNKSLVFCLIGEDAYYAAPLNIILPRRHPTALHKEAGRQALDWVTQITERGAETVSQPFRHGQPVSRILRIHRHAEIRRDDAGRFRRLLDIHSELHDIQKRLA